jgi:hypothetical protein
MFRMSLKRFYFRFCNVIDYSQEKLFHLLRNACYKYFTSERVFQNVESFFSQTKLLL